MFQERGYEIYGDQVRAIVSGMPVRIYDFVIVTPDGQNIGIEVKSTMVGNYQIDTRQAEFDVVAATHGARISGTDDRINGVGYVGVNLGPMLSAAWSSITLKLSLMMSGVQFTSIKGGKVGLRD
jgi:hypothetical protein